MKTSGRETIVTGHEQIATVLGSVAFASTKHPINPGLGLYAWLSDRARGWEKYRFKKFEVVYVPAEAVTTTAGSIYLAIDYNPSDAAPSTLPAMSTYETQTNDRVYNALRCNFNPQIMFDGVQNKRVRAGPVAGDLGLYDGGSIIVSTISCADASAIGQLWVYYEICLISPQIGPALPVPSSFALYNNSADQTFATGIAELIVFNEVIVDGMELAAPVLGLFTLPAGTYLISGEFRGTNSSAEVTFWDLDFQKNGAVTVPPQTCHVHYTSLAGGDIMIPFTFYMFSDGNDTMALELTATGAAGTLQLLQDNARIAIRAV
jgi:hypothetical protein